MLYVVATPIGNLQDITLRALEILKSVDLIACEDTRVTTKLLNHYQIKKPLVSYHQHSKIGKVDRIIEKLKNGKKVAVVTDAGTPGVSDPGNVLVAEAIKNEIKVIPIPGVSALTTIVGIAGIDLQKFVFLGFPPHKKGRETFFKKVLKSEFPVIYYDSVYRILKNLKLLQKLGGQNKNIILGRELTKIYEETMRGKPEEILNYFKTNPEKLKGEFVVIVE